VIAQIISILGLVLSLVENVAPTASTVAKVVQTLEGLLSVGTDLITQITPAVKNIIAALRGKDGITQDQLDSLAVLEQKWDDAFDQAAKDEGLDDEPAAGTDAAPPAAADAPAAGDQTGEEKPAT
jgi:hypothetical protein